MTARWREMSIESRGTTRLGISFRPPQAEAFGLDPRATLTQLLAYPFQLIRLGAYWNRMEPAPGRFDTDELDWEIDAAAKSSKQVLLCVGAVKTFSYPEFYVPAHHLPTPLPEGSIVDSQTHQALLEAAIAFVTRVVERYKGCESIVAWQVEHEAVDPLGMEHSWRLGAEFVQQEAEAARLADPSRPIVMSGFLPTSLPIRFQQWWRTRDQGDSLAVAQRLADIVGIDYYPRHALATFAGRTVYLDGSRTPWQRHKHLISWAKSHQRRVMVTEGQAEPWETVTTPPNPGGQRMYSCMPEQMLENYNQCVRIANGGGITLDSYLFWGAEYWMLRKKDGDSGYLEAFERVLG